MVKNCFLCLLMLFCGLISYGQNTQKMNVWQDSLLSLGKKMFTKVAEPERMESNFTFVKTLVSALKEPNSYYFKFDKLKMVSVLSSPDNAFRIFSWNLPLQDGSFLYYGAIQHRGGTIKLTPLLDKTFEIKDPNKDVLTGKEWYGAQYYDIQLLSKGKYVLLGWKGHHADFSQKVIDILNIDAGGNVTFGSAVFADDPKISRKIFSYTREATMYLKYNPLLKRLEFDHMVPAAPNLKGNYKYYGPDLSYDAYEFVNGKLLFKEDVKIENVERGDEKNYIDPKKPNTKLKSGL